MLRKFLKITRSSLHLWTIFDIDIRIHWSFLLLIMYFLVSSIESGHTTEESMYIILFIFNIFGCIILHELGHSLVAKKFNFHTDQIVILPIGGMAQMKKIPKKPIEELLVAIAGPMVNLFIAITIYIILGQEQAFLLSEEMLQSNSILEANFLFSLLIVNLIIGTFNLIPAFPMDGGRVLRSLLALKMNRKQATKIAAMFGKLIAISFIIIGLNYSVLLSFIGFFIFMAAKKELEQELENKNSENTIY